MRPGAAIHLLWVLFAILSVTSTAHADSLQGRALSYLFSDPVGSSSSAPPASSVSSAPPPAPVNNAASSSKPAPASSQPPAPSSAAPKANQNGSTQARGSASPAGGSNSPVSSAPAPASGSNQAPAPAPASPSVNASSSPLYPAVSVPVASSTSAAYDVMAVPTSFPQANVNVTSNVTIPAPSVTATWNGTLPPIIGNMYRGSEEAKSNLPTFYYNIANSSVSNDTKTMICQMQTNFCATAGCSDDTDEISHNFCDVSHGMATMCTCKKSLSRLPQYQWPVQSQDCLLRMQRCVDLCNNQRETPFMRRSVCMQSCQDQIGSSCDKTVQYGVSYMVDKPGKLPTYQFVDQSQPQSAGARLYVNLALMSFTALATGGWLVLS